VFDLVIRADFKYFGDYTKAEREMMKDDFTTINFPWGAEFPMVILTIFLFTILISLILCYNLLTLWLEKICYHHDVNQIYAQHNILDYDQSEMEIEVSSYKFKAPGLIRKITSTYFKKSGKEDMKIIKRKVDKLIRRYKRRLSCHSIDLENMMRDRDFQAPRNGNRPLEETKINDTTMITNIGKI
jgi:hypothetical protein